MGMICVGASNAWITMLAINQWRAEIWAREASAMPRGEELDGNDRQESDNPEDDTPECGAPEEPANDMEGKTPARPMGIWRAIAGLLVSAYILLVSVVKVDEVFFHGNDPEVARNANNLIWTPLAVVGVPLGVVLVALYLRRIWQIVHGNKLG